MSRLTDPDLARLDDLLQHCTEAEREQIYRLFEADGETLDALPENFSQTRDSNSRRGFIRMLRDKYFITKKKPSSWPGRCFTLKPVITMLDPTFNLGRPSLLHCGIMTASGCAIIPRGRSKTRRSDRLVLSNSSSMPCRLPQVSQTPPPANRLASMVEIIYISTMRKAMHLNIKNDEAHKPCDRACRPYRRKLDLGRNSGFARAAGARASTPAPRPHCGAIDEDRKPVCRSG